MNKTGFCNGPFRVNPFKLHSSPVTCFCPQSVWKPLLYGVGEDRPANLIHAVTEVLLPS
jgi:hypothetical protein